MNFICWILIGALAVFLARRAFQRITAGLLTEQPAYAADDGNV